MSKKVDGPLITWFIPFLLLEHGFFSIKRLREGSTYYHGYAFG